jgi:hypothetical protein
MLKHRLAPLTDSPTSTACIAASKVVSDHDADLRELYLRPCELLAPLACTARSVGCDPLEYEIPPLNMPPSAFLSPLVPADGSGRFRSSNSALPAWSWALHVFMKRGLPEGTPSGGVQEITAGGEPSTTQVQRGLLRLVIADHNHEPPKRFAEDAPKPDDCTSACRDRSMRSRSLISASTGRGRSDLRPSREDILHRKTMITIQTVSTMVLRSCTGTFFVNLRLYFWPSMSTFPS